MKKENPVEMIIALGIDKFGNKSKLARAAGISRQTLHNIFKHKNPTYKTFQGLLKSVDYHLQVERIKK